MEKQRRLFHAPVLDIETILKAAVQHEKEVYFRLKKEKTILHKRLCSIFNTKDYKAYVQILEKEKKRQYLLWRGAHRNYARSVENYLESRRRLGKIDSKLVDLILSAFLVVKEIQEQRQKQILRGWDFVLSFDWEKTKKKDCQTFILPASPKSVKELMRPCYLAFYRFLRLLPAAERSRFLTAFRN